MTEEYRFFDNIEGDREYNADAFAEYFRQVLTSGVLNGGTNLQVTCDGTDMKSHIKSGKAWLEGYYYKDTDDTLALTHDAADGTYDRIDRIILHLDKNTDKRYIKAFVLKGVNAVSPVAPDIIRTDMIYEISLAQVYITHNTSIIASNKVTDERLDTSVCGLVNSLIQVDTTLMQERFDAFMESLEEQGYVSQAAFDVLVQSFTGLQDDFDALQLDYETHKADYTLQIPFSTTAGVANTYTIATTPALSSLIAGVAITAKFHATNSGASTLNWDGKGAIAIKNPDGTDLASGDLALNGVYTLRYDGTNFILQGKGGVTLTGTAQTTDVLPGKTFYNTDPKTLLTGAYSNIKSVQRGSYTFGSTETSKAITISAISLSNAVPFCSVTSGGASSNNKAYYNIEVTNSTTITIAHNASGSTDKVAWEVVEFNNVKSLQRGTANCIDNTELVVNISAVNQLKSKIFVSFTDNNTGNLNTQIGYRFISDTQIGLKGNWGSTTYAVKWYVVEFN